MAGIFDKVVDGLNKGVATVGANSKAMMEKAQVKTAIKNLEVERKELAELLGMRVYETYIETNEVTVDKSVENFIAEIGKRLDGIELQQAEMKRIEDELNLITGSKSAGEPSCACGHAVNADAKFCAKCGNAL